MTTQPSDDVTLTAAGFLDSWNESYEPLRQRIEEDTVRYRQAETELRVLAGDHRPCAGLEVRVEQVEHEFLFGANSFMLEGYETAEENRAWSDAFTRLFNLAVVPFYWKSLQPERGRVRFEADSRPIYRRPPPDLVLDWAEEHGITPKGHPLFWSNPEHLPAWLPGDVEKWRPVIRRRLEEIADRYDERIHTWDGVNEVLNRRKHTPMPRDYVRWIYEQADDLFRSGRLFVNEAQPVWRDFVWEDSHYYMMIRMLRELGCRIDGIGLQHHAWGGNDWALQNFLPGGMFGPEHELEVLDQFADFGLPMQISEITIPAAGLVEEGERIQARLVEDLYRLWFSHPAMEGIIYWNMADGHGHKDQAGHEPGLVREDFAPKPAGEALDRLVNDEWRTEETLTTDADGRVVFRGYKGLYRAIIGGEEHVFTVGDEPVEQMLWV